MTDAPRLILASRSAQRARLLNELGLPFTTAAANLDEAALKGETPMQYVQRIAAAKAQAVAAQNPGAVVLAADTPVILGRSILQTPQTREEAAAMLRKQSNRRVQVPTAVAVVDGVGQLRTALCQSWVKFKPFTEAELEAYLHSGRWEGVSGAICIESFGPWVVKMHGSYSGIIGLPLFETARLLRAAGLMPRLFGPQD